MKARYYQSDCVEATLEAIKHKDNNNVINILPTGAGKTLIMNLLIDELGDRLGFQETILSLCHLKDIGLKNKEVYEKHGKYKAIYMAGKFYPNASDKVVFSSMQTACKTKRLDKWLNKFGNGRPKYILIDEVHYFGCKSYDLIRNHPKLKDAKLIGFTATPFRNNQNSLELFDKVAYQISMEDLQKDNYLAKLDLNTFTAAANTDTEKLAITKDIIEHELKRDVAGLLVYPSIERAKECYTVLTQMYRCSYMDGTTGDDRVAEIVADISEGRSDLLIVCRKGLVGLDAPRIKYCVIPYGVKSIVAFLQIAGRAVRPYQDLDATLYIYGDTPSVRSGKYRKMLDFVKGIKADPEASGMLREELDYLLLNAEQAKTRDAKIKYLEGCLEAAEALEKSDARELAQIVSRKVFPKKYSKHIRAITSQMVEVDPNCTEPVSDMQKKILETFGLREKDFKKLSQSEARAMIIGFNKHLNSSPWIIKEGIYKGKHWNETSNIYRSKIKNPRLKNHFYSWINAGRPD